jgi:adenine-specific DNA-methyltransferase
MVGDPMSRQALLEKIKDSLNSFSTGDLENNALALFESLGYRSSRRFEGLLLSAENLSETFNSPQILRPEKALTGEWQSVHLLFQLTDEEISADGRDPQLRMVFDSASKVDPTIFRSYIFFAVELKSDAYTRGQLAGITREINRLFPMPVMVLFKHGSSLTLAIIYRRPHKKETEKDVLEKVTLIKDIRLVNPHRAHLEILADLALEELYGKHRFTNFLELHQAWQETLNISELNKRFYSELANWYFWAVSTVCFPAGGGVDEKERNAINVIRLITRLIFVWFIREKGLVPEELFDRGKLEAILNFSKPEDTVYYKAVLQNLFFATLNVEMNKDAPGSRTFTEDSRERVVGDYLITNKYRYRELFKDAEAFLELCADIPFLNGGLFECLDREISADELTNHPDLASRISKEGSFTVLRVDGFSRRKDNVLHVPDMLFFSPSQKLDLNEFYGTQGKHYKVCGFFPLLSQYKFTVEENTPIEEEVALDPELLGKVFENLLAAFNPETGTTARKQTGSFYTPREIVNYMVDEALVAYLETALTPESSDTQSHSPAGEKKKEPVDRLRSLLAYEESPHDFQEEEVQRLIRAIEALNSLDPACGSGAFPMGLLHKLVYVLQRLDPDNTRWRDLQKKKAVRETGEAYKIGDHTERQTRLLDIEDAFTHNTSDYGRKLYLIENCIYGVDIQPIAVQIAKLRFFISLVVEQKMENAKPNRGIRPLPNLETKFVAANTLIGIQKAGQQGMFRNPQVVEVEEQLREIRHKIFSVGKSYLKRQYRQDDERLRKQLTALLKSEGWGDKAAAQLASWDPYDQNTHTEFFDPEWMFGVTGGFDVVIGNPPYGLINKRQNKTESIVISDEDLTFYKNSKEYAPAVSGMINIFKLFVIKSINLLRQNGVFSEIFPLSFVADVSVAELRKNIFEYYSIDFIEAFPERDDKNKRVFEVAKMSVCIMNLRRVKNKSRKFFVRIHHDRFVDSGNPKVFFDVDTLKLLDKENITIPLMTQSDSDIILKVYKNSITFSEFGHCYTGEVDLTLGKKYLTDNPNHATLIKGAIIDKYLIRKEMSQGEIKFLDSQKYLIENKGAKSSHHQQTRIVMQGITGVNEKIRLKMTIAQPDTFCGNSVNYILFNNDVINIYLGVLNSKLLNYIFSKFSTNSNVNGYEVDNLPYPRFVEENIFQKITSLVTQILEAKWANPTTDTSVLEREIDQLVYGLYGLTEEEIAIVDGKR